MSTICLYVVDCALDSFSFVFVAFSVCSSLFSGFHTSLSCLLLCFFVGRRFIAVDCGVQPAGSWCLFAGSGCCSNMRNGVVYVANLMV